jgi:hypothetical protein
MPEANNQSAPVEGTRVEGLYVERLYNLGNYENFKVGVRVAIGQGDDPGRVLVCLENIFESLRAKSGVSDFQLERAKRALAKPESDLDATERANLEDYRSYVKRDEDARERRRKAVAALSTFDFTIEYKDHKEDWTERDDIEF